MTGSGAVRAAAAVAVQPTYISAPNLNASRFQTGLRYASLVHIMAAVYRLAVQPLLLRRGRMGEFEGAHGRRLNRQRYNFTPQRDEEVIRNAEMEYKTYSLFILMYGIILAGYERFGSQKMQRIAMTIETFRVSCYVFISTLDGFEFTEDMISAEKFLKQLWDLIGVLGLLGNICAVCDDRP